MKTKATYKKLLIALSLTSVSFLFSLAPGAAAPPDVHFHASFHAGVSLYTPVVSYSARIRMFSYPSVSVGYLYDPVYLDPWYGGGGYYYNSGYGSFSVTFSFGYPYYYAPVWSYYPVVYYPPVWYYPPVSVWTWPAPYYSYHYSWHGGCRYYGRPHYDPYYHSYGSRGMVHTASYSRPARSAEAAYVHRGAGVATSSSQHGVRSRAVSGSASSHYARRSGSAAQAVSRESAHRSTPSATRRSVSTSRSGHAVRTTSSYHRGVPARSTTASLNSSHRRSAQTVSRRSGAVTASQTHHRPAGVSGSSSSYARRVSTATYHRNTSTTVRNGNMNKRTVASPATVRRSATTPAGNRRIQTSSHRPSASATKRHGTSSRKTATGHRR